MCVYVFILCMSFFEEYIQFYERGKTAMMVMRTMKILQLAWKTRKDPSPASHMPLRCSTLWPYHHNTFLFNTVCNSRWMWAILSKLYLINSGLRSTLTLENLECFMPMRNDFENRASYGEIVKRIAKTSSELKRLTNFFKWWYFASLVCSSKRIPFSLMMFFYMFITLSLLIYCPIGPQIIRFSRPILGISNPCMKGLYFSLG